MAWGKAAICGVGASRQGKLPGETPVTLAAEALRNALEDSGIKKNEIDGLLTLPGTSSPEAAKNYLTLGERFGINPRYTGSLVMGGATAGACVEAAAMAVQNGMANVVACIFADTAATGGAKFGGAAGGEDTWAVWGMLGNAANSALGFRRHMALYGTRSEQLGWIAVTCRKHALMNPNAVMKKPMTIEDHQNSRMIVDPLHMFDCCLISDGAVCILVTSPERAKDCRKKPVSILGMGQGHTTENLREPEWWYLPHQARSIADAYKMAGVGPGDIDVAQFYDNFTVAVLFWLEHAGFCKKGEAGAYVEGGKRIALGGDGVPINTAGGNLSESYMQGWLHVVEGVRQIRGECGPRQVKDAEICLVTGRGMTLNTACAMILGELIMSNTEPAAPAPKPIKPVISETNKPFWDGCREHRLMAQKCTSCQELRYPVADICPNCLSKDFEWRELSGHGELMSYIIIHRGYHPYWALRVPYNVAFIQLDEGLRMFSNIVGTPNEKLAVGQRVKVAFEQRDEDLVVPVFEVVDKA